MAIARVLMVFVTLHDSSITWTRQCLGRKTEAQGCLARPHLYALLCRLRHDNATQASPHLQRLTCAATVVPFAIFTQRYPTREDRSTVGSVWFHKQNRNAVKFRLGKKLFDSALGRLGVLVAYPRHTEHQPHVSADGCVATRLQASVLTPVKQAIDRKNEIHRVC